MPRHFFSVSNFVFNLKELSIPRDVLVERSLNLS